VAAALTVQALDAVGAGFVTAWPCDAPRPFVSAANVEAGDSVANHLEVALSASGDVCLSVSAPMQLVVDLVGWFGAGGTTEFHGLSPTRLADSRDGVGVAGAITRGASPSLPVTGAAGIPASARAVVAQVTAVDPTAAGWLSVTTCRTASPTVSMVRYGQRRNAAALVTSLTTADGRWCIAASGAVQVVVDAVGWFG
jgi:hypothetical protein